MTMSSLIASHTSAMRAALLTLLPAFAACSDAPTSARIAQGAGEVHAAAAARGDCTVRCVNPIAFDAAAVPGDAVRHIYTVMPDGSGLTQLTSGQHSNRAPSWSANYRRIVFTSNRHGGEHNVYSMNAKGQGVTRLTNVGLPEYWPVLSPDGTKIVWVREFINGQLGILLMNSDGTNEAAFPMGGNNMHPTFSPDSKKILFSSNMHSTSGSPYDRDIYVMNLDGSGRTRLTSHLALDENPVWSPDGSKIFFESDRSGEFGIYKMNPDGTNVELVQMAPAGSYIGYLSLNADGTRMVYYGDAVGQRFQMSSVNGGPSTVLPLPKSLQSLGTVSWSFAR
jgi:Tol biopolymer transport system component